MSRIFGRHTTPNTRTALKGNGPYVIDTNGKRYLDCGDAAVSCLGHSDTKVTEAIKSQLDQIAFAHSGFFTSEPAEKLASKLIEHAPEGIEHVYLLSGGSEAVEAAIKLARQYYTELGQNDRYHVIARRQSYHGNTIGALSAGGNEWRRAQFGPMLIEASHIAPPYSYRDMNDDEDLGAYGLRIANELEIEINRVGANKVLAFIAEPVVGATAGALVSPPGYLKRIREICDQYDIMLILDEVMCGMGRTGYLFASEHDDVRPDIITIAKGLGAGYQPIGAMLCSSQIFNVIRDGSGFFQHGHTYMGHPIAAAAALAVLESIEERELLPRVRQMGKTLETKLTTTFGQHPHVGDIRGRGLFWAIELVENRNTKEPFASKLGTNKKIKAAAMDAGLICYPMGGTIDGQRGDHVLLAPPFILTDDQLDELVGKLKIAIDAVLS